MGRLTAAAVLVIFSALDTVEVSGQEMETRFGFGAGMVLNPSNREVSGDDLGYDFRFRVSQPMTRSLSFAIGVGSFVFDNGQKTEFVVNPQVLLIATLPGNRRFPYLMAGVGAVLPAEQERQSQIEVHSGFGWAWPFGVRMSAFVETNPGLAIRDEGFAAIIPLRAGLIF